MLVCELEKIEGYEKKILELREELDLVRESWEEIKDEKRKIEEKLLVIKVEKELIRKQFLFLDLVF